MTRSWSQDIGFTVQHVNQPATNFCYLVVVVLSLRSSRWKQRKTQWKFVFIDAWLQLVQSLYLSKVLQVQTVLWFTSSIEDSKIEQATGPHRDLLTIVKRCKLQWYGHVSLSLGLAKTILQGTVKGGRRQGSQRKRWEDNIRERTGLEFAKSQMQRAVENREKLRKLVAKSSVLPQCPLCLRDWWWWWLKTHHVFGWT